MGIAKPFCRVIPPIDANAPHSCGAGHFHVKTGIAHHHSVRRFYTCVLHGLQNHRRVRLGGMKIRNLLGHEHPVQRVTLNQLIQSPPGFPGGNPQQNLRHRLQAAQRIHRARIQRRRLCDTHLRPQLHIGRLVAFNHFLVRGLCLIRCQCWHRDIQRQPNDAEQLRPLRQWRINRRKGAGHGRDNIALTVNECSIDIKEDQFQRGAHPQSSSNGSAGTSPGDH